MKASGVDVLLTAAFGGVAGTITGKSWTNALHAYTVSHARIATDHGRVPSPMIGQYKLDLWVNTIRDTGINGDAALRDCHTEKVTSFQALQRQKKSQHAENIESGIFGSWFLESVENAQQ